MINQNPILTEPASIVTNEDCMEVMARYPDKYFDLAIVDPPYGIGEDGRKNHTRGVLTKAKDYQTSHRYDHSIPDESYFLLLQLKSKHQIIWGGNYFTDYLAPTPCWIVWDKDNGENDFADVEMAWGSFDSAARKIKYRWHGMLQENMKDKEERIHPNHKPIFLYEWILQKYAKQDNKILDTHLGSGSSRIAAHKNGFEFVGCELDKDYFEAQEKRFKEYKSQLRLF